MGSATRVDDGYVLERTAAEYERLRDQARIWKPETERLLARAGTRVAPLPELMFEAVHRSVLPAAPELGLTTQAASEQWFEAFAREPPSAVGHVALWALLVGTWTRREK